MRNGLVHLEAVVNGWYDRLLPATPAFFSLTAAPFDYDHDAPPPRLWLRHLDEWFDGDQQSIDALQEQFGLCLVPDTSHHKILVWIGPPRGGKGTAARVLHALVGEANVAAPTLTTLAGEFGLWPLVGKSLAIISDARLSGRADVASAVTERLLMISGEDAVTINRKGASMLTMRLPTRFLLISNELPKLGDASGALANRFIISRFRKSFLGREDKTLTDKLLVELPGILKWSIQGWHRLRTSRKLTQPEAGKGLMQDMLDLSSPVSQFIQERCVLGAAPDCAVPTRTLYEAWCVWCEEHGRNPGVEQQFGRDLVAAAPDVTKPREHERNAAGAATGRRVYVYRGIRLRRPADEKLD
jgi:putative DNA primase/helicase